MQTLKVIAEGPVTSFRYPHFLVGRQPTFRMPPPATIYGHVASALGELFDPSTVDFAYAFFYDGIVDDVELQHVAGIGRGTFPGRRDIPRNLDVNTNPVRREMLVNPKLTLYLKADGPMLLRLRDAFRTPKHVAVLGRSQDLVGYRTAEIVELVQTADVYIEGALLPWSYRNRLRDGVGVTMPRFISPHDRRSVAWSPYVVLLDRVTVVRPEANDVPRRGRMAMQSADERWWADPADRQVQGRHRAVIWQRFVDDDANQLTFFTAPARNLG